MKPVYYLFTIIMIMIIFVVSFDAYMKFSYINSRNYTKPYNNTTFQQIPQLIPKIPVPFINIIFLVGILVIILLLFYGLYRHFYEGN